MSDMEEKERSRDRSRRDRGSRYSESSRDRSIDRGRDRGGMKSSNCRVYVSNIPYEYRWQDLKDLFRSQVGDVQFVELFVDENDKSRGCGIVEFSDQKSVKKCLEVMQRFEVKTRKLIIKEDTGNIRDKHGNIVTSGLSKRSRDEGRYRDERYDSQSSLGGRSGPSDTIESKWGNTYGLSPQFLESLHIDTPLCNRVFVANLEYNVDKKKLKEVFRLAGRIINVDLHRDKDGRSRGFAVIEYDHPVEAVQAISMFHNQVLNDRTMTVRIDRAHETFKLPDGLKGIGMGLGTNGEPLRDVARNLPSLTSNNSLQASNVGVGILGAMPNQALQMANALSGLNSVPSFAPLTNSTVLQAANLAGVASNLLGNGLSNADLSLASLSNSLVQNTAQLGMGGGGSGGGGGNTVNTANIPSLTGGQSYGRDTGFGSNHQTTTGFGTNQNYGSSGGGGGGGTGSGSGSGGGRNYQNFETKTTAASSFGGYSSSRDSFAALMSSGGGGGGGGSNSGGGGSMVRGQNASGNMKDGSGYSKIIVSNLPTSATFKMLHDKFKEFGDVQHMEEKGTGSMLVVYGTEWQAERAIKNLDRARIDGRTIDARFFY